MPLTNLSFQQRGSGEEALAITEHSWKAKIYLSH